MRGVSFSLIDHILTNIEPNCPVLAGTIVFDIRDYFINLTTEIQTPSNKI
jgi:hypothetical protein